MEILLIIALILIFYSVKSINDSLSHISNNLSSIKYKLEGIHKVLGGEQKEKELLLKEWDEIKKRLIDDYARYKGISKAESIKENENTIKTIENEIKNEGFSDRYLSTKGWVEKIEKWFIAKEKYGHLLNRTKEIIKSVNKFTEKEIEKELKTDYSGAKWLISMLRDEKMIEPIYKYKSYEEGSEIVGWEVVNKV